MQIIKRKVLGYIPILEEQFIKKLPFSKINAIFVFYFNYHEFKHQKEMKQVTLHNKTFEISIPEEKILGVVKQLAERLNNDLKDVDKPIFISILNGSFMFTADLIRHINIPCEVSFLKLSSYSGTQSSGKVRELIGLTNKLEGRTVIILEDIVDTGNTLEELASTLRAHNPKSVKLATLLLKPDVYKKDITLDYVGLSIPNEFIVGYGLDYDELGRNLRDIYTLVK